LKIKFDQFSLESMGKDPLNWRVRFTSISKDPRLFVPKYDTSLGLGMAFNCANVFTYIIIIGFILIVIASRYLL